MQPCCRTSLTAVFNDRVIMLEPLPENRNLHAVQEQSNAARHNYGDGQEQDPTRMTGYRMLKDPVDPGYAMDNNTIVPEVDSRMFRGKGGGRKRY